MSFYHGVTVSEVNTGSRPIAVPSSSIIGVVATMAAGSAVANVPTLVTSLKEAVELFGPNDGSAVMPKALEAIYKQCKAVVVAVGVVGDVDEAATVSAIVGGVDGDGNRLGIDALLDAKSILGIKPRILVAEKSDNQAVASKLFPMADRMRSFAVIDGPNTDDAAAGAYAQNFGYKRGMVVDPGARVWSVEDDAVVDVPMSFYVAGLGAKSDHANGYWASWSNQEISGIMGTKRPIDYEMGDTASRANLLNNQKVSTVIREGGFRFWGNRTLSADAKWAFMTRVRTADIIMDAILAGHQWAIDRGITKTYVKDVLDGLRGFMASERAKGAVINFEAWVDEEKSTLSELEQGRVYWNIKFTDVPVAENPNFSIEVTNEFLSEIF